MSPAEAYRKLQIRDPDVADDMVISSFVSCVRRNPVGL